MRHLNVVEGAEGGRSGSLLEAEVDRIEAPVGAAPAGKAPGHVRGAFQVDVVEDDGNPVAAQHHVLLDKIGTHGMGHGLGRQGVFGQVPARTRNNFV